MQWLTNLIQGIKSLLHPQRVEAELDEELQSYLEFSIAHKRQAGMLDE